ncbi:hypothetical protein [Zhongshania sp. BJYM1]|nr:hypothetical protein [Marortus sp. BJYM1]
MMYRNNTAAILLAVATTLSSSHAQSTLFGYSLAAQTVANWVAERVEK